MARRISVSQLKSKLRQAEQKRRQAINRYNKEVRRHNQNLKNSINKYNREVNAHNNRVRANRQRIKNELNRLSRQSSNNTRYVVYRTSVNELHSSFIRLENHTASQQLSPRYSHFLDLSERETANSLEITNKILNGENPDSDFTEKTENPELLERLRKISVDVRDRWRGAVFSLNPNNPDAARHFCTSAREVITKILELKAPDTDVFALLPNCDKTDRGNATRRSRIKYFLHRQEMTEDTFEEFVENDMENIIQLFRVFNSGTHGSAGTFSFSQLNGIKKRVEDGIFFLSEIIGDM